MGGLSIWHWLIVIVVIALLFGGRGKLSGLMGDAAKGLRAFRDGLKGDEVEEAEKSGGKLPRTDAEKEDLRQ